MGIGTFGSFTQARLGIYAAQAGLQVTGNNISNINTRGYTRQRLDQTSLYVGGADRYSSKYDLRIGQGVLCTGVSQLRDPYLDIRYRNESAHVGQMEEKLKALTNIATILDETGKGSQKEGDDFGLVAADIADLESTLRALTTETGHQEFDNQVRAAAISLCARLNSYATRLQTEYETNVENFENTVKEINSALTSIRDLNETIRNSEIHGQDALELRDERNVLIDDLSKLIHIDVTYVYEDIGGGEQVSKLIIKLANDNPDSDVTSDSAELINGIYGSQISIEQVPEMVPVTDDPATWRYVDANGNPVKTRGEADTVEVENPNWTQATKPTTIPQYLKPDGTPTNDPAEAAREPKLREDGAKIYVKPDGSLTSDKDEANMVNNPNLNITVSELRDSRNKLLFYTDKAKEKQVTDATELAGLKNGTIPLVNEQDPRNPDGSYTIDVYRYDHGQYFKTTYTKTPSRETPLDDNDLYGGLQAMREMLTEAGEFTDKDIVQETYNDATDPYRNADENALVKRGIPYYQKSLDLLANQLAKLFNDANNGFMMDSNGNYITEDVDEKGNPIGVPVEILDPADATGQTKYTLNSKTDWNKEWANIPKYVRDELAGTTGIGVGDTLADGTVVDAEFIVKSYLEGQVYDANGKPTKTEDDLKQDAKGIKVGVNLFSNRGDNNDGSNITATNISVSDAWRKGQVLVNSFVADQGKTHAASGDSTNLNHMKYLLEEKQPFYPNTLPSTKDTANGDLMFTGTIREYWNNVGFTLGQDQKLTQNSLETHETNALQIDMNRDSISSVDFNDEAMNLMMYAKSYNAACRLMTTIDSVLDKLINNTGMTT